MKFTSWPAPPIRADTVPPEIPPKFRCFGLEYVVENGNPKLNIPRKALDRDEIRQCINRSFSLFLKTLTTLDGTLLDEIRDVHTHINEEINKAIAFEEGNAEAEAVEEKIKMRNEVLRRIESMTNQSAK